MSFKLTAYKNRSRITIPIEDKHAYISSERSHNFNDFNPYDTIDTHNLSLSVYQTANGGFGYQAYSTTDYHRNIAQIFDLSDLYIPKGTGAQERIGDKVYVKQIQVLLNLYLKWPCDLYYNANYINYDSSIDTSKEYLADRCKEIRPVPGKFKFRVMLIDFMDLDISSDQDVANWFNAIFVPQYFINASSTSIDGAAVSNQSKLMRESVNDYTGKYKILYDRNISLSTSKGHKFVKFDYSPKMNITFDSNGHPQNDGFKNVKLILVAPTLNVNDMDRATFNRLQEGLRKTTALTNYGRFRSWIEHAFTYDYNIKYTYYDI